MILKTLREEVLEANLQLVPRGLVLYTFGNASGAGHFFHRAWAKWPGGHSLAQSHPPRASRGFPTRPRAR